MNTSIIKSTEKSRARGRPRKETVAQHFTMSVVVSEELERWASAHGVTRPEAIRRLIQAGLEAEYGANKQKGETQ